MQVDVYVPLLVSLLFGVLAGPVGRRLPPDVAVRLLVPAAVVTAAGWVWALALLVWTAAAQLSVVAAEGHWSRSVFRAKDPVAGPVAYLATIALTTGVAALVAATVRGIHSVWTTRALARQTCRTSTGELVVVPDDAPEAFALPGAQSGRIVVTTGMLAALDSDERRVLFAHERAHLYARHQWWMVAVQLAAAADPLLARLPRFIDHMLERWADEYAAVQVGNRRLVARALAHAGLAALRHTAPPQQVGVALRFAATGVRTRVAALLIEPSPLRWPIVAAVVVVVTVATAAAIDASNDLENLFELVAIRTANAGN
ncbi:MAG: M56 family metallopeptidase [Streptosporangiales bacterium]